MKAFLTKYNQDGSLGIGSDKTIITREYKSFAMLYRYAIVPALKAWDGRLKAEIFYNWDRRYSTPDRTMTWNNHIFASRFD
jgi:hypothetical protein